MPLMIGCQQQADAERQDHEDQRHGIEFLDGGERAGQQEDACQRRFCLFNVARLASSEPQASAMQK